MIFMTGRMKTGEEENRASARLTCLLAQPQDTPHASCYASYTPLTSTHTLIHLVAAVVTFVKSLSG